MATQFSYSTFVTAVLDAAEEVDGSDFDSKVDELIQRGEDRVLLDLDLTIFDAWDSITFVNGTRTATLPTNFLKANSIYYEASSSITFLEPRTQEYILDYWPSTSTTTTTPKFFAPYSDTQVIVGGTPGATPTTGTCNGLKRPNSLVADTSGTWLSKYAGNLLLHGVLIEAMKQLEADERIAMFEAEYGKLLAAAQNEFRHLRRPGNYL